MRGRGAVAIWHDVAAAGRDTFYAWHGHEHMHERVSIPGFLRGRRYRALDADLEFFNLYEATSLEVLKGPGYQDRLNDPTPWTLDAVGHFRSVNRSLCTVRHTRGGVSGGLIATVRYDAGEDGADAKSLWTNHLAPLAEHAGVAGVHLLAADRDASAVDTKERQTRAEHNIVPTRAILLEGWGEAEPFMRLCRSLLSPERLAEHGVAGPSALGVYQLQLTVDPRDGPSQTAFRSDGLI